MAAFTSKASGNWSSGGQTTWNEVGVPGAGDTVTIGAHNITVDVDTIIGTSPNNTTTMAITHSSARTLTVAAGRTLTVRGNIQHVNQCGIALAAGASLIFDNSLSGGSPIYRVTNGGFSNYVFSGTALARCTFGAIVGQSCSISGAWDTFTASFADIVRVSGLSISAILSPLSILDTTFTGCGQCTLAWSNTTASTTLTRARFVSGTGSNDLQFNNTLTPDAGVTRTLTECAFQKTVVFNTVGFAVVKNYFGFGFEAIAGIASFAELRDNFVLQDGTLGNGNGMRCPSTVRRNYFAVQNLGGNPHYIAPTALFSRDTYVDQNVFEGDTPDLVDTGDCVLVNQSATSGGFKVIGRNNIVLPGAGGIPSGTLLTIFDAISSVRTEWFRNTANINDSAVAGKRGAFAFGEAGSGGFANQLSALKSNIAWGSTPSQGYLGERVTANVKDIVTAANADYNWRHNLSAGDNQRGYNDNIGSNAMWTAGDAVAAGVDVNGVADDPEFYDSERNLASWNAARGYGAATFDAGLQSIFESPTRVVDLVNYIFEGFRVRNAAARNAAHDGGPVGAANYIKASRYFVVTSGLGAYLQDKYDIAGSSVAPDIPVSLAVSVAVVRRLDVTVESSR